MKEERLGGKEAMETKKERKEDIDGRSEKKFIESFINKSRGRSYFRHFVGREVKK